MMSRTVEGTRKLKISELHRRGMLVPGAAGPWYWTYADDGTVTRIVRLRYGTHLEIVMEHRGETVGQRVRVERTACHLGGSRPWFRCHCGRRVATLFDGGGAFACRRCLQLSYSIQREAARYRPLHRAQSLRMKLGGSGNMMAPFPDRPRYMRRTRYAQLMARGDRLDQAATVAMTTWTAGVWPGPIAAFGTAAATDPVTGTVVASPPSGIPNGINGLFVANWIDGQDTIYLEARQALTSRLMAKRTSD
jgi:hypothetical protein